MMVKVILPAPYWVSYFEIVLSGGLPVVVPTSIENDFKITPTQLEAAITPKTKMMWFSSPCNPSGSVYSREELTALAKVLENILKSLWLQMKSTSTSTLRNFCSIASIPGMLEKTVTVNGVAKHLQ
jgi:aspartate aminotransferase